MYRLVAVQNNWEGTHLDAGIIYQEKTEFVQYVKKLKLAMNSIIYFHMIILITKENCTLKERLETDLIL
jgi:hypothetical protein